MSVSERDPSLPCVASALAMSFATVPAARFFTSRDHGSCGLCQAILSNHNGGSLIHHCRVFPTPYARPVILFCTASSFLACAVSVTSSFAYRACGMMCVLAYIIVPDLASQPFAHRAHHGQPRLGFLDAL